MRKSEAVHLRGVIESSAQFLDDATASTAATLFPAMKHDGGLIKAGHRINWFGVVKRAAVDLWAVPENDPDKAPNLWCDLDYRSGYRIIPETITVSLAFSKGECGWWGDVLYRSLVDSNVYTPAAYPANWEAVNG